MTSARAIRPHQGGTVALALSTCGVCQSPLTRPDRASPGQTARHVLPSAVRTKQQPPYRCRYGGCSLSVFNVY